MSEEEKYPEITPTILPDVELQKKKEEAREQYKKMMDKGKTPETTVVTNNNEIKTVSELTLKEQEDQIIKCITDPIYFIETYLKIFDQTQGEKGMIVPFKLFDFQKYLIQCYLNEDFNIANKYRQAGISTTTCAFLAWYIMFNKNRSVAIIADKIMTAQDELMNDVIEFVEGCPEWLKPKPSRKNTQKLKRYDNGSEIGAFAAKSGLRGYTPTLLFWDETAWTEKGDKFWESAGPTLQTGGAAIMISTPSGYDAVFYKTFNLAVQKKNNFYAIELYWFNDPRYNIDLKWYKNRGKDDEICIDDENFDNEKRIKLYNEGWEPHNEWMENQIKRVNGDMRKINQELKCVFGDSFITIRNKNTKQIETIKISDFYKRLNSQNIDTLINNTDYEILNSKGEFVDFKGIIKHPLENGKKITLEDNNNIIVSNDHMFFCGEKEIHVSSLVENNTYITTLNGDKYIKKIEDVKGGDFYDIFESENYEYLANNISNHNCQFLGSGDNFIAGEYLKRIGEKEVEVPIRQEYTDGNMWIWEDPDPNEEYISAIDVSSGHGEDYSTVNILKIKEYIENTTIKKKGVDVKTKIKKNKLEQVAEYYGKISPQGLAEIAYIYGTKYNNAYTVVDITGGHGGQTINKLFELGYVNVHYSEITHKPSRDMLSGYIKKGKKTLSDGSVIFVDLIPGFYIGNNRGQVLLEFQRAIHLEELYIRSSRTHNELKTFLTAPGSRVADHGRSFHDDSIIGIAIGTYTVNFDMKKYNVNDNSSKDMIDKMLDINNREKRENYNEKTQSLFDKYKDNPYGEHAWLFYGITKK